MELLEHQKTALEFISSRLERGVGCLHSDPAGTGKTLPALLSARKFTPDGKICLWVTLASLKEQLENEIVKFSVPFKPLVLKGTKTKRLNAIRDAQKGGVDIVVVNYEQILLHGKELSTLPIAVIVTDECSRLGNIKNKTYKYLVTIAKYTKAKKIALSGTPITNTPMEAYALFEYLNTNCLGNWFNFVKTYMLPTPFSIAGAINHYRLPQLATLLNPYYIRREREVLLPFLPDLIEEDLPVELSPEEEKFYKLIKSELLLEMQTEEIDKIENPITMQNGITKFMRLRQFLVHPSLIGSAHKKFSKLESLKEFLSTIGENKAIIFTEFSSAIPFIQEVVGGLVISGSTPQEERQAVIDKFQSSPDIKHLIMTRAGELGLNLQSASYVVHYDPPLTYSSYDQRNSRARRQGRQDKVISVRITVKGSIEDRIWKLIERKRLISLQAMPYNELIKELLT